MNIQQLKVFWNAQTEQYSVSDQSTGIFLLSLLNMVKFWERNNILEVGAGGGYLIQHILSHKKKDAAYTATDLSENMVQLISKRLGVEADENLLKNLKIQLQVADCENLPFSDSSFDCYIANLVIHCTLSAAKMLEEARRVLQKGGYIALSAIGPKNNLVSSLNKFTLTVMAEYGIELKWPSNSSVQYDDRESMIKALEDAGFENVMCWQQHVPFPVIDERDFEGLFKLGKVRENISASKPEKVEEILSEIVKRLNHEIKVVKMPLTVQSTLVVAQKK